MARAASNVSSFAFSAEMKGIESSQAAASLFPPRGGKGGGGDVGSFRWLPSFNPRSGKSLESEHHRALMAGQVPFVECTVIR